MHRANMSTWVFDFKIVCTEIETDNGQHQNQTNERNGIGLWMAFNKALGFLAGCNTALIEISSPCVNFMC